MIFPTIIDIIRAGLTMRGKNEFFNDNKITTRMREYSFIHKAITYDNDVDEVVTTDIFYNFRFKNKELDRLFKKAFVNKFLNRSICSQTIEVFTAHIHSYMLTHEDVITSYYEHYQEFITNKSSSDNTNTNTSVSDDRMLTSNLPEDNINLNVEDTVLDFGSQNTITRHKNRNNNNSNSNNQNFNPDNLFKLSGFLDIYLNEMGKQFFSNYYN